MRRFICLVVIASYGATAVSAVSGKAAFAGANLAPMAKISLAVARSKALQARPGVITDQELEKEKGGSGLRYSFDIKSQGKTFEVGVDAASGMILENKKEGKNPD